MLYHLASHLSTLGKHQTILSLYDSIRSGNLSLPSPRAFFAFLITERLSTTVSEPGTGYEQMDHIAVSARVAQLLQKHA